MTTPYDRRTSRLAAYDALRAARPHLFANPPGAGFEILFDRARQDQVADTAAAKLHAQGLPEEFGDIGVLYQDDYMILVRDAVRFRSGALGAYIRDVPPHEGPGTAVLAVLPDGRIPLLRHFRHSTRAWHWELPRGFGEPGSTGSETARREVEEELGATVKEVTFLGGLDCDTGTAAGGDEIYLARIGELPARATQHASDEGIDEIRLVTPREFTEMIRGGAVTDSFTLAAYTLAKVKGVLPADDGE